MIPTPTRCPACGGMYGSRDCQGNVFLCPDCSGTVERFAEIERIMKGDTVIDTVLVNLYGGPGTGKSTTAAHLFALLKQRGVSAELVQEYAKGVVWEEHFAKLEDQLYILAKQNRHTARVMGKVSVVITDSPILLSLIYGRDCPTAFKQTVRDLHNLRCSFNVFLKRVKPFEQAGRVQDELKAKELDYAIREMLTDEGVQTFQCDADRNAAPHILNALAADYRWLRAML